MPLRLVICLRLFCRGCDYRGEGNEAFSNQKKSMKRMHVMLSVKDLDEAVKFYSALFDSAPTVAKPDYAKWTLEDPRVNFSLAERPGAHGIEHLGIQAETAGELDELRACCYAKSDKTWVVDAQGVAWEAFHTSGSAPAYYGEKHGECCQAAVVAKE